MKLFKLTGEESILKLNLERPILLDENTEYELALIGFYSDNYIYNLSEDGEIYFDLKPENDVSYAYVTFEKGYWTLGQIQEKINTHTEPDRDIKFEKLNNRIVITTPYYNMGFSASMRKFLGFTKEGMVYNKTFTAEEPPYMRPVDVIEIHCNIIEKSYVNHETHWHKHDEREILYTFFPDVTYGSKISERPEEKFYTPLKKGLHKIQEIVITIQDQDNNLIQNPDVNNIVYLSLIKK